MLSTAAPTLKSAGLGAAATGAQTTAQASRARGSDQRIRMFPRTSGRRRTCGAPLGCRALGALEPAPGQVPVGEQQHRLVRRRAESLLGVRRVERPPILDEFDPAGVLAGRQSDELLVVGV